MKKVIAFTIAAFFLVGSISSQEISLDGFVYDDENNRKLFEVILQVYQADTILILEQETTQYGKFKFKLPAGNLYRIDITRSGYRKNSLGISTEGKTSEDLINLKIPLNRLPGYEFEATLKKFLAGMTPGDLSEDLSDYKIEIYNNVTNKEELVIENNKKSTFTFNLERGNHYTLLLRKKGYFAKRIEINVNIYDCILCFEGLGTNYQPEIQESMTKKNSSGILETIIPLRPIIINEAIRLENIYYDYDKWNIRADAKPGLNHLVGIMKSNPIIVELGSHTDSRGKDEYNLELSRKRAKSAVDYIITRGIDPARISSKGYGENVLVNQCADGVECSEKEHQLNRRTEFKVLRFMKGSSFDNKSLKQIIETERQNAMRQQETLIDTEGGH